LIQFLNYIAKSVILHKKHPIVLDIVIISRLLIALRAFYPWIVAKNVNFLDSYG